MPKIAAMSIEPKGKLWQVMHIFEPTGNLFNCEVGVSSIGRSCVLAQLESGSRHDDATRPRRESTMLVLGMLRKLVWQFMCLLLAQVLAVTIQDLV